ncbi:Cell cycle control protein 50A [Cichlidogyrus casuarinus]|uniref:Cell cycle control protein 50A n=1 Tax=Cichlidogyrus casuarinus TaxID=1844966 RepID=A0ABD2QC39_9PLAT
MYYELDGFYQNHRRFVNSVNWRQILGTKVNPDDLSSCAPFDINKEGKMFLPCGAMANSLFSDRFYLFYTNGSQSFPVTATDQGIAWPDDINRKYGHLTDESFDNTVKPLNWTFSERERTKEPFKTDEALMIWMRPALTSNFRKLYKRVLHNQLTFLEKSLPAGQYRLEIAINYPVQDFGGRKAFVIANTGFFGSSSKVYPITSVVLGSIHFMLGIIFAVLPLVTKRKGRLQEEADSYSMDVGPRVQV